MHCVQFEMRLNQLLDDRRDPECDLDLAEHARECPGCADLLVAHETLLRGVELRRFDEPSAGRDFAVRVAADVARSSGDSAWQRWSWSVGTIAAALLLALAALAPNRRAKGFRSGRSVDDADRVARRWVQS